MRNKVVTAAFVAVLAGVGLLVYLGGPGKVIARVPLDADGGGQAAVTLGAGDVVELTLDLDVAFPFGGRLKNAAPRGCFLDLWLEKEGDRPAGARCSIGGDAVSVGCSSHTSRDGDGLARRQDGGLRTTCAATAAAAGDYRVKVASNLPACVRRFAGTVVNVHRDAK